MAFEHVEGSDSRTTDKDLYSLTVERLRALLRERGLSPKGKKASIETISLKLVLRHFLFCPMGVLVKFWIHINRTRMGTYRIYFNGSSDAMN